MWRHRPRLLTAGAEKIAGVPKWDNQQMDKALRSRLEGREILVIAIEDLPSKGQATTVMAVTRTVPTTVNIERAGSVDTKAFVLSQEEALQLAQQITDAVGGQAKGSKS